MKRLEEVGGELKEDSGIIPVGNLSAPEKRLLNSYMSVNPNDVYNCETCNNCGSGDCGECCETGDD